jgi:hypothetical protein
MTVASISSGATYSAEAGASLSWAAARFGPVRPIDPVRGRPTDRRSQVDGDQEQSDSSGLLDAQDVVELSPAARQWSASSGPTAPAKPGGRAVTAGQQPLTDADRAHVEQLKKRDTEVRAHEQAHLSAAGSFARGGAKFTYQTGPDGRAYAVGGEVDIDTTPVPDDPQATILKMETVRAAALAPASPSAQDEAVADRATQKIEQARAESTKGR